jgi:tetratricopeptide (TPR) repeat protein
MQGDAERCEEDWYDHESDEDMQEEDIENLAQGVVETHANTIETDWKDAYQQKQDESDDDDDEDDHDNVVADLKSGPQAQHDRTIEARLRQGQGKQEMSAKEKTKQEVDDLEKIFQEEFETKAVDRVQPGSEKTDTATKGSGQSHKGQLRSSQAPHDALQHALPMLGPSQPSTLQRQGDVIRRADGAHDDREGPTLVLKMEDGLISYDARGIPGMDDHKTSHSRVHQDDACFAETDAQLVQRIQGLTSNGKLDAAEDLLMKELEQRPNSPQVLQMYAEFLWFDRGDVDAAGELFDQLVEVSPDDVSTVCVRADFLWCGKGDAQKALSAYQVASFLPGAEADVFHSMAMIHHKLVSIPSCMSCI